MAYCLAERAKEYTSTTGTGSFTLSGAVTGFVTLAEAIARESFPADSYFSYVAIHANGTEWEAGVGKLSGSSLVREAVQASSNADAKVNFTAGSKTVSFSPLARDIGGVRVKVYDSPGLYYYEDHERFKTSTFEFIVVGAGGGGGAGMASAGSVPGGGGGGAGGVATGTMYDVWGEFAKTEGLVIFVGQGGASGVDGEDSSVSFRFGGGSFDHKRTGLGGKAGKSAVDGGAGGNGSAGDSDWGTNGGAGGDPGLPGEDGGSNSANSLGTGHRATGGGGGGGKTSGFAAAGGRGGTTKVNSYGSGGGAAGGGNGINFSPPTYEDGRYVGSWTLIGGGGGGGGANLAGAGGNGGNGGFGGGGGGGGSGSSAGGTGGTGGDGVVIIIARP